VTTQETELDHLWRAVDQTRAAIDAIEQRLARDLPQPIPVVTPLARSLAPTPDYRSEREPELCGCEEAVALRAEAVGLRDLLLAASLAMPTPWPLPRETGLAIQRALSGHVRTRNDPEHAVGCRYEQEHPALDPEDCPRCSQVPSP